MAVAKRTWKTPSGDIREAWVVRYYDVDGIYRAKQFKRQRDARAYDAQIKEELRKGIHRPDSTSPTVSEAATLWLERARAEKLEPEVIAKYQLHWRVHILPATAQNLRNGWSGTLGDVKLSRLTAPLCEAFKLQLMKSEARRKGGKIIPGRTISRKTARDILTSFKMGLRYAQKFGLIAYNPAQPVRINSNERELVPIQIGEQIPDWRDVRVILAESVGRWRVLNFTAALTGMRASELRGLAWPNVHLDRGTIEVRERADWKGRIGPCKSRSAYRTIQIGDDLVDELRRWKLVCPPSRRQLVFPLNLVIPDDDGTVIPRQLLIAQFNELQERIVMEGLHREIRYTFHALRHFYASIMIDQGTPPKRLQYLLGHASIKMTMDTYGHLFPPETDEIGRINSATARVLTA